MKKVILKQLGDHLQRIGLFEEFQSGFRVQHSTETAPVKVMNDLMTSDCGLISMITFARSQCRVHQNILLQRLELNFGFKGIALHWFELFLSNRLQFVYVKGESP